MHTRPRFELCKQGQALLSLLLCLCEGHAQSLTHTHRHGKRLCAPKVTVLHGLFIFYHDVSLCWNILDFQQPHCHSIWTLCKLSEMSALRILPVLHTFTSPAPWGLSFLLGLHFESKDGLNCCNRGPTVVLRYALVNTIIILKSI